MDALKTTLANLIVTALETFDKMLGNASSILSGAAGEIGGGVGVVPAAWAGIQGINSALQGFCYVIIAICLLIEIAQISSKVDVVRWETGLKICIKMVLSVVMIDLAPTILTAIYRQSTHWVAAAAAGGGNLGALMQTRIDTLIGGVNGFFAILGLFLSVFVVMLGIQICGMLISVMAYGRLFEIFAYLAVSPVPCAFFPLGGGSGFSRVTSKFFKAFAAVCLQAVMMIVCIRVFGEIIVGGIDTLAANVTATGTAGVAELAFLMLMGCITLVMSMVKSGHWAKAILDAI